MLRSRALETRRQDGAADAPGTWVQAGPVNIGGRITALGVDSANPSRIWIGTAAGGVFRTDDEGASFVPVFDDQAVLSIGSLAVHPSNSDVGYRLGERGARSLRLPLITGCHSV